MVARRRVVAGRGKWLLEGVVARRRVVARRGKWLLEGEWLLGEGSGC